jgi:general secretion pathway protein G
MTCEEYFQVKCFRISNRSTERSRRSLQSAICNSPRGGFTLLEIIVVVFILSLLAAIIAPRIIGRTDDARITEAKVQIRNFETALKLFKLDNGFYPSTDQGLEALIEKPTIGRIPNNYREGGYLEQKKIPLDPWGNPYIYVSPGIQGDFDILSFGADGKEGGEGKDADIKNWDL